MYADVFLEWIVSEVSKANVLTLFILKIGHLSLLDMESYIIVLCKKYIMKTNNNGALFCYQ